MTGGRSDRGDERDGVLSTAALDTLPLNVAVIDADGEILLTNRGWREFAVSEGGVEDPEELGTNYLAAAENADDADSRRALEGVQSVLTGEQATFEMEYPCHSPERRRWFLMRVAPFERDGERYAVVAHADITDRKLAELAADERADQLAHLLERINGLVRDVAAGVVQARSRGAVERAVCEAVAAVEPYRVAWIGRPDLRESALVPRASAGDVPPPDEGVSLSEGGPVARAYRTGELQVRSTGRAADGAGLDAGAAANGPGEDDGDDATAGDDAADPPVDGDGASDDPTEEPWWPPGARAVAAVPLAYRASSYGVLVVGADRADAFDERERTVFGALGDVVATALHAVTSGRVLETSSVVEVELTLPASASLLAAIAGEAELAYEDALVTDDGDVRLYVTATGGDPEAVVDRAADREDVTGARVLTAREDGALLEVVAAEPLVATVADFDGVTAALSATGDGATATLLFPDEGAARAAFEHLDEHHRGVELVGYRDRDRSPDTADGFRAELREQLTERQLTAIRLAYHSGYFEWPRDLSGEEVAEAMGISRSTFHQHLRAAEAKLAAALLEPDPL